MLPKARATERTLQLQSIIDGTDGETFAAWPGIGRNDYALVGGYIVLYSYIDLNLRRMVEVLELAGKLPHPIKNKYGAAGLRIGEVEDVLLATDLAEPNRIALENIKEYR